LWTNKFIGTIILLALTFVVLQRLMPIIQRKLIE